MVAHMQDVSIARRTNDLIGPTDHQSADVSCPEKKIDSGVQFYTDYDNSCSTSKTVPEA